MKSPEIINAQFIREEFNSSLAGALRMRLTWSWWPSASWGQTTRAVARVQREGTRHLFWVAEILSWRMFRGSLMTFWLNLVRFRLENLTIPHQITSPLPGKWGHVGFCSWSRKWPVCCYSSHLAKAHWDPAGLQAGVQQDRLQHRGHRREGGPVELSPIRHLGLQEQAERGHG